VVRREAAKPNAGSRWQVCDQAGKRLSSGNRRHREVAQHGVRDSKPKTSNSGSKQWRAIAMLQSPADASVAAMMKAAGWKQHSERGFLAGVVRQRLKLKLGSKKVDGTRLYRVAGAAVGQVHLPPP
jgi:hypothetical protein